MYVTRPESSAHWYRADGTPCYTVPAQDGSERPTTLRDARKMGLYPSVTTVLSVMAAPQLQAWKIEQAILSALTLPRVEGEDDQAFAARVVEDMGQETERAAQAGTDLHGFLAKWHLDPTIQPEPGVWYAPHVEAYAKWFRSQRRGVVAVEQPFAHSEGWGGRVDLILECAPDYDSRHEPVIVDWKSEKTKPGEDVKPPDSWVIQLAAYAHHWRSWKIANVVFSTTEPGRVEVIWYDIHEAFRARKMWYACFELWKLAHRYDPLEREGGKS